MTQCPSSTLWLFTVIVLFHLMILFSLYQVHTRMMVTSIPHADTTGPGHSLPPPSQRLILLIVDGLTVNDVFSFNNNQTPFLRHILHEEGRWGLIKDFVAKEPRVGHVAITSGLHDHAYLHGFDLVNHWDTFDSILNASNHIWAWGVTTTTTTLLPWLRSTLCEPGLMSVQYGGSNKWLFKSVEDFFHTSAGNASFVQQLARDKQIFYLHLVATSSTNTSLQEMVAELNEGLGTIHEVVNAYYKHDQRTTFILTSSYGRLDEPQQYQNLLPFVAWGAGIKSPHSSSHSAYNHEDSLSQYWQLDKLERLDLQQVDIAPLMATLLGTRLPVHSTGLLPIEYIHYNKRFVAHSLLANAKQLTELARIEEDTITRSSLFPLSLHFKHSVSALQSTLAQIEDLIANHKLQESILLATKLISKCSKHLKELSSFHRKYYKVVLSIAMPIWILYLTLNLVTDSDCTSIILYLALPTVLSSLYIMFCLHSSTRLHYDLILLSLSLSMLLGMTHRILKVTRKEKREYLCKLLLPSIAGCVIVAVIEQLTQSYESEIGFVAGTTILVIWTCISSNASRTALILWVLMMLLLNCSILLFPTCTNCYFVRVSTGVAIIVLHLFLYSRPSVKHLLTIPCRPCWWSSTKLFATQLFVLVLAVATTILTQCKDLLPNYITHSKIAISVFSALLALMGPLSVAGRLYHLSLLLFACFLQLDSEDQSLLFLLTCIFMAMWIHIESRPCSVDCTNAHSMWHGHLALGRRAVLETCNGCGTTMHLGLQRRAFVTMHLVMMYFWYTGIFDLSIYPISRVFQLDEIIKVALIHVAIYTAFHIQNLHTQQSFKNSIAAIIISFDVAILSQLFHIDGNWIQVRQTAFKFIVTILAALAAIVTVAFSSHLLTGSAIMHKQQSLHAL